LIDKIDGLGGVRAPQAAKRAGKTGSSGGPSFAKEMGESSETSEARGVSGSNAVTGILNIQEVDDALAHASKGKRRAQDILDRLEELRIELLSGGISKDKLLQLGRIVAARRASITDPHLAAILDEIDLRAQVEMAKHYP
jgi:hypothetical protein